MSVEEMHPKLQRDMGHKDNVTSPCVNNDPCESRFKDNTLKGIDKTPNCKIESAKQTSKQNDIITGCVYSNGDIYPKGHVGFAQISHLSSVQETQLKANSTESISTTDSNANIQPIPGSRRKNRQTTNKTPIQATNTTLIQANGSIGSPPSAPGNNRQNCTSSGGYPGVSWNRRMGAWLSFYYDNYCRRSRTFHPKHYNMDVEAARLAAVSFIKTVEGNPRSKKIKRTDKGIRPKFTSIVPKAQYANSDAVPSTAPSTPHCQPVNGPEYVSSTNTVENSGWNPYYVVPNEDYYPGENYWNSMSVPDAYSLPEQLCGYAPNSSMVGFMLPTLGYMNYGNYYARHISHSCPQAHNLSGSASPSKDFTQSHYVPPIGVVSGIYDSEKRSDLESPFYLNSLKCSQPATTSTGFYLDQ